jgi:hypothetical protein
MELAPSAPRFPSSRDKIRLNKGNKRVAGVFRIMRMQPGECLSLATQNIDEKNNNLVNIFWRTK